MILFRLFFTRIGRAGQAIWTVVTDRPTSRRVPWGYLCGRAVRSPRMWLQIVTILAVLVVYPMSFVLLDEQTRDSLIVVIVVMWVVTAFVPVAERWFGGGRSR